MSLKTTTRFLVILLLFISFLFGTFNLRAKSSQATIPINITVSGKLIITDAENDNRSGTDPTLNVVLKLTPELNSSVISGRSAIRIRTNLNNWKLTAQRRDLSNPSITNIDPKDVSVNFTTQAGSKANPNAGRLISPFDSTTSLGQISTNASTDLLIGNTQTSIDKDPENKNNWFQLTSDYSISPDFFYGIGEWDTIISYSLVSP
ncbi:MAG: hypothetical protein HY094_06630 [Candidatus Melainabacteria bacterium]|nr:hypothetical protein [Candidatus Melainabacteria bacterium]